VYMGWWLLLFTPIRQVAGLKESFLCRGLSRWYILLAEVALSWHMEVVAVASRLFPGTKTGKCTCWER
jgi:hypothetical protein